MARAVHRHVIWDHIDWKATVHNHQPVDYHCPFCSLSAEQAPDVVYRTERVFALVSPRWWPNNPGHLLIIPIAHHENLYDLPASEGLAVFEATRLLARTMRRVYGCDGVSTRQHNEPSGGQDVWHFHQHLFPRYPHDNLYGTSAEPDWLPSHQRQEFATKLRAALNQH
ncbi:HIT family protein [Streptomyces sp. NRRL WC-3744]|uniref:HIT family protein n=1 Tax=Streptomyces sp. NRRL WC-3744 TaxID=1463935 RepID=UPI0018FEB61B|nr:HIT family protein [Streptomyces sp. NRRL WC-3744]